MAGGNAGSFPSANPVVVQTPSEEVSHQLILGLDGVIANLIW
jgi:hypothetical protein